LDTCQATPLCPAAITIHNNRDVTGNSFCAGRHCSRANFWNSSPRSKRRKMTKEKWCRLQRPLSSADFRRGLLYAGCAEDSARYSTIVSPRPGPTLTMDNFPPVNSEMYLTYFLAANGSCENFRAERVATASNQPQRRFRPVVAPNSRPRL